MSRRTMMFGRKTVILTAVAIGVTAVGLGSQRLFAGGGGGQVQLPTTIDDFFLLGTQPDELGMEIEPITASGACTGCHSLFDVSGYDDSTEPYKHWTGSMMAQSARDPIFYAALTIANQDAADSGDLCIRCHSPGAWLGGRSTPTDASGFTEFVDFDGVTCHFCHRMVDPVYVAGTSPIQDQSILDDLANQGLLPFDAHSANYVIDPADTRRGPNTSINNLHGVPHIYSPFHSSSTMCATCHDVSNPALERQLDGTYAIGTPGQEHATLDKYDMFPVERTFSEWSQSAFATGGVQMNGRFGGPAHPDGVMQSCQDCHMPRYPGVHCTIGAQQRPSIGQHAFAGANTWVLRAVRNLYGENATGLFPDTLAEAYAQIDYMHQNASDMELSQEGSQLKVRIINMTGHKLPTGYPEGRRMWINVKFYNDQGQVFEERGHYDFATAELTTSDTKVYEAKLGLDAAMAAATNLPAGESFHFVLNNTYLKDNRIPPMGFTNTAFEAVQAAPVGYTYADGQHWDDTYYDIPVGATDAEVTVYYQTTSKEYIEFLRDENVTDSRGQVAYDQWELEGKSAPAVLDAQVIMLSGSITGDLNGDGVVSGPDLAQLLGEWGPCPAAPDPCPADLNGDMQVNGADLAILLGAWT